MFSQSFLSIFGNGLRKVVKMEYNVNNNKITSTGSAQCWKAERMWDTRKKTNRHTPTHSLTYIPHINIYLHVCLLHSIHSFISTMWNESTKRKWKTCTMKKSLCRIQVNGTIRSPMSLKMSLARTLSQLPRLCLRRFHFQNQFVPGVLPVYYSTYKMNDVCFERNAARSLLHWIRVPLVPNSEHFFHAFRIPIHESWTRIKCVYWY